MSAFTNEAQASFTALLDALSSDGGTRSASLDRALEHASNAYSSSYSGAEKTVADTLGQLIGGVGVT
jgi:hypothetical protein